MSLLSSLDNIIKYSIYHNMWYKILAWSKSKDVAKILGWFGLS